MSFAGAQLLCNTVIYVAIITASAVVAIKIVDVFTSHKKNKETKGE